MEHIESRPSKKKRKAAFELYLEVKTTHDKFLSFLKKIRESKFFPNVLVLNSEINAEVENNKIWIPMSIWDLDKCNHLNIKYEPDIDSRHPVINSVFN